MKAKTQKMNSKQKLASTLNRAYGTKVSYGLTSYGDLVQLDVRFQFERQGYFYADPIDYTDAHPVFNKIVGLKDSWSKKTEVLKDSPKPEVKKVHIEGDVVPMSEAEKARFETYTKHGLNSEIANTLARDEQLSSFYEETLSINEKTKETKM